MCKRRETSTVQLVMQQVRVEWNRFIQRAYPNLKKCVFLFPQTKVFISLCNFECKLKHK